MKKIIYLLAIGTYALFLTGCVPPDDDNNFEPQTITPVLIAKGENCFAENLSGINMVIKTDEAWNALLNTLSGVTDSFIETEIDFTHYMALAVFEEVRPHTGCTIEITDITEYANNIVVNVHSFIPNEGYTMLVQPYHIVKIPKSGKSVLFERTEDEDEVEYPIEIPFEDYSLEGTSCGWTHFGTNTVIVINGNEELEDYIECTESNYPEIDFSNKTLLLAKGGTVNGIENIAKHFMKTAASEYSFNVDIILNDAAVAEGWLEAILVPKIVETAIVELNVAFNQEPIIVCGVENPVTDLPWLKELIDGLISDEEAGYAHSVRIYQCTYRNGIGFLLDLCVGCPDFGYMLTNCEGETLCVLEGHAGDSCTEYNVDC